MLKSIIWDLKMLTFIDGEPLKRGCYCGVPLYHFPRTSEELHAFKVCVFEVVHLLLVFLP